MKTRTQRLRSPSFHAYMASARAREAEERAHSRSVATYPGAYTSVAAVLATMPTPRDDTAAGIAARLLGNHGASPEGIRAALHRIQEDGPTFEGPFWDLVRGHLRKWLEEHESACHTP